MGSHKKNERVILISNTFVCKLNKIGLNDRGEMGAVEDIIVGGPDGEILFEIL